MTVSIPFGRAIQDLLSQPFELLLGHRIGRELPGDVAMTKSNYARSDAEID
ncbi:hypothetical protein [Pseudomonas chlororaphis]|uniref:hypothetical protein n=1 Tax=Pseudomonas chlororaphis TaxID=587753 RepID=UPI000B12B8AF|nr:hypothetical protein [Pseudomonas chlororaphis]